MEVIFAPSVIHRGKWWSPQWQWFPLLVYKENYEHLGLPKCRMKKKVAMNTELLESADWENSTVSTGFLWGLLKPVFHAPKSISGNGVTMHVNN